MGRNPCVFGENKQWPVGSWWRTRKDLCDSGVHGVRRKGIHGRGQMGAFSIVLSAGYEEDKDNGEEFIYSGEGGGLDPSRRGSLGKPMCDQEWIRGNAALMMSKRRGLPVRVIRGARSSSSYAPPAGYRYDGLYNVVWAGDKTGSCGYKVCVFRLVRRPDQAPIQDGYGSRYTGLRAVPPRSTSPSVNSRDSTPTAFGSSTTQVASTSALPQTVSGPSGARQLQYTPTAGGSTSINREIVRRQRLFIEDSDDEELLDPDDELVDRKPRITTTAWRRRRSTDTPLKFMGFIDLTSDASDGEVESATAAMSKSAFADFGIVDLCSDDEEEDRKPSLSSLVNKNPPVNIGTIDLTVGSDDEEDHDHWRPSRSALVGKKRIRTIGTIDLTDDSDEEDPEEEANSERHSPVDSLSQGEELDDDVKDERAKDFLDIDDDGMDVDELKDEEYVGLESEYSGLSSLVNRPSPSPCEMSPELGMETFRSS